MNNIHEIWGWQSKQNDILSKIRIEDLINITCYVGIISVSNAKIFILEIDKMVKIQSIHLKRFTGVEIQILPSDDGKKELAIILMDNELSDIFTLFIEDIIKFLGSAKDSEEAVFIISRRISYWKKLFGRITGGLLSPEQIRGLFGELNFFKKLLDSQIHPSTLLNAWQAPQAENQDYYFPNNAIEIKTTKSNSPIITISNEFQLNLNGFDHIFLAFYHLNEHPGTSSTLFQLINQIREYLQPSQELIDAFNIKLVGIGIDKELEEDYNQISYKIIKERYYEIEDDFPRIIPFMIQESVSRVSYHIDPVGCKDFEIDFKTILNAITSNDSY